jgi:hypothetical protein
VQVEHCTCCDTLTIGVRELARDRKCNSWELGAGSGRSGERWSREREEWEREGVRSGEGDACDVVVPDDV